MTKAERAQQAQRERKQLQERMTLLTFTIDEETYLWYENYEEGKVALIKAHLRTPEQKQWLFDNDLSIEDVLNGRFGSPQDAYITGPMFAEWNQKMGHHAFGF
jgi:hypothetical protein